MSVRQAGKTWRDEWELLCEGCGYSIEGLPGEEVCPECGKQVQLSMPSLRTGTSYQRRPCLAAIWPTMGLVLLRPRVAWTKVQPVWWVSWQLQNLTLAFSSLAYGIGLAITLVRFPEIDEGAGMAKLFLGLFAAIPIFILGFLLLRMVEWTLRVLHRPPNGRMDAALAVTIIAHANSGLAAGGIGLLGFGLIYSTAMMPPEYGRIGCAGFFGIGMSWFAILTIWGSRKLQYANRLPEWLETHEENT